MKTNKVNPLTAFRKLTEARQAKVKKSLKKAQDGIEMNDDMINKAGSTGGYKKSLPKYKPWEGPVELINPADEDKKRIMRDSLRKAYNEGIGNNINRQNTDILNEYMRNNPITPKKKGGSVKRKK